MSRKTGLGLVAAVLVAALLMADFGSGGSARRHDPSARRPSLMSLRVPFTRGRLRVGYLVLAAPTVILAYALSKMPKEGGPGPSESPSEGPPPADGDESE